MQERSQRLADELICPECHSDVVLAEGRMKCQNIACGRAFPIKGDIPVMLISGNTPENEDSGYYPKVKGGTMEDNPDPGFSSYDARIRTHYLKKYLDGEPKDGRILDLCCSKAPFYPYLETWGYGGKVYGVDLLMDQLQKAYSRGVLTVQANALRLPFPDGYFSKVIFTDALVHLLKREDQQGVFNEIARVLKRSGCLIMTATNLTWVALFALLRDVNFLKNDVCTYYSRREIENLASGTMKIERYDSFAFYGFLPWFCRRSAGILVIADRLLNVWPTRKFGMVNFFKLRRL